MKHVVLCLACHKPVTPADPRGRPRVFCSRECTGRAIGTNGVARIHNPAKVAACAWCKKEFTTYHRARKFCTKKCASVARVGKPLNSSSAAAGGIDQNQDKIVSGLRAVGASVHLTSGMGRGFPDLVVGFRGVNFLMEVKNPDTSYGRSGFAETQKKWAAEWKGSVVIVMSLSAAMRVIGLNVP